MSKIKFRIPFDGDIVISSRYAKRDDPMNPRTIKKHNGIDYEIKKGTKVLASASGEVIRIAENEAFGNLIIIDHAPVADENGRHIYTLYGHLSYIRPDLGEYVLKNEWIGDSGNTGVRTTNPHLHFGVFDSKYATDKLNWKTAKGPTGVHGYNASNPENYIGHGFELDGAILDIIDLNEKLNDKVGRVMALDTTVDKKKRAWHSNVIIDRKKMGYLDNRNLELKLSFSLAEAIAFLRKPMKERKTDTYYV